jgi:hypothetical protein
LRGDTEEVGESAAVLVGTTMASTVSLFKAFSKGRGNDDDLPEERRTRQSVATTSEPTTAYMDSF